MSQTITENDVPSRKWSLKAITRPTLRNPDVCRQCSGPLDERTRRGLCRHCHADRAVRRQHRRHKGAAEDFEGPADVPRILRTTPASSAATRRDLRRRVVAGEELFWPGDCDAGLYDRLGVARLLVAIFGMARLAPQLMNDQQVCLLAARGRR